MSRSLLETLAVALSLTLLLFTTAQAQTQCAFTSSLNNYYDLTPLKGKTYATNNTRYTAYVEYISVCDDVVSGVSGCASDAAVCEKAAAGSTTTKLAVNPATIVEQSAGNLVMTYATPPGTQYSVKITFTCAPGTGQATPIYQSETTVLFTFTWATQYACVGGGGGSSSSSGLSGGDVFLILFFVGGFLYIVIGMAVKYKRYDSRGVDMIPNIDFWRDLPSLIKDGMVFTWTKIMRLFGRE